jgi:hypothetical protein
MPIFTPWDKAVWRVCTSSFAEFGLSSTVTFCDSPIKSIVRVYCDGAWIPLSNVTTNFSSLNQPCFPSATLPRALQLSTMPVHDNPNFHHILKLRKKVLPKKVKDFLPSFNCLLLSVCSSIVVEETMASVWVHVEFVVLSIFLENLFLLGYLGWRG